MKAFSFILISSFCIDSFRETLFARTNIKIKLNQKLKKRIIKFTTTEQKNKLSRSKVNPTVATAILQF